MDKVDFKKIQKELCRPPSKGFVIIHVPEMQFLMIATDGLGP
jgi:hypothetical protein